MNKGTLSRRDFMGHGGKMAALLPLTALSSQRVLGANDRINIGLIGCGSRGRNALMKDYLHRFDEKYNFAVTAVCDVWRQHREQAAAMARDWYDLEPKQFEDYRDLLALDGIDAVMIACPDFRHCEVLEAAAKAGKDAYCEKPLGITIEELNRAVDAVKANNRIVQVGTQLRSMSTFTGCKKVVQDGVLGSIIRCEQSRNSYKPYWHSYVRDVKKKDANWKLFLKKNKDRPFDADKFSTWYGYREFSDGPIGGFMSHFVDLVHYITGARFPHNAVTIGGIYAWKDQRTCPDQVQTILEYPEGFLVSYSTTFGNGTGSFLRFIGMKGSIDATNWSHPVMSGNGSQHPERIKEDQDVPEVPMHHHMEDWLICLRTREQPNANIDAGYQHAVACILVDEAMVKNRRMMFDADKREIRPMET